MKLSIGVRPHMRGTSRPGEAVVEIPVTLAVPSGFGRPARQTEATIKLDVLGYLNGSIVARAEVEYKSRHTHVAGDAPAPMRPDPGVREPYHG